MNKVNVRVPWLWTPRRYQWPVVYAIECGVRRYIKIWHRRAGKDLVDFNITMRSALTRTGAYWHIFPTYTQGRKAIWEGSTREGRPYLDFIPKKGIKVIDNQQTRIEFINGSVWRIVGADHINSLMGAGPKGVVFSEYALQRPGVWDYIQPMLLENDGWALFNGTPRGENHFYDLVQMAENHPKWRVDIQTIADTSVISDGQIDDLRHEGKAEAIIQQEYYCSFAGAMFGAYYGDAMRKAEAKGRIGPVPVDPNLPVHTVWDLGINDATAIWFYQTIGHEIHLVDYYENHGQGLAHYVAELQSRGYAYGSHFAPHDIKARELGTGKSRLEMAKGLGVVFKVVQSLPVIDGIDAVRALLPACWFDKQKTKQGIKCLKHYRQNWDDSLQRFHPHPLHDWSSNGADAFRYLAVSHHHTTRPRQQHFKARVGFVW